VKGDEMTAIRNTPAATRQQAGTAPPKKTLHVEFLTGPQVQARYQKSHVTIWRWMNDISLGFPAPIQINRLNYWRLSDLEAWEAAQAKTAA
jgi:predicted DNA-binding transcriptional regulator AlpA